MQNTILHWLTQKSTLEILALEMVVRGASGVLFSPSLSPAGHQPEINACKHPMDKPTAFGLVTQCSQEKQPRGQLEPPLALFRWQQDSAKPPAVHWYHWDHCYGISPTCCSVCGSGHQVTAFIQSPAANGGVSSTTLRVQAAKGWWH